MKRLLAYLVAGAALLFSPFAACGHGGFHYGAREMRSVVEGTWVATLTPTGGQPREIVFRLEQAGAASRHGASSGLVPSAHACGHRSLIRSAEACIDTTEMPLSITVLSGEVGTNITGDFTAYGYEFTGGRLSIQLDKDTFLSASLDEHGNPADVSTNVGTATLARSRAGA